MSEGLGAGAGPGRRRDRVLVRDSVLPPAPLRAGVTGAAVPAQQVWTCRARVSSTLRTPGPSWPRTLTCHPLAVRLEPARAQRRHRRTPCASPSQDAADAGAMPGAPGPGVRLRKQHARWRQRSQRPWCSVQPVRRWPPVPSTRGLNARRCRWPRGCSSRPPRLRRSLSLPNATANARGPSLTALGPAVLGPAVARLVSGRPSGCHLFILTHSY